MAVSQGLLPAPRGHFRAQLCGDLTIWKLRSSKPAGENSLQAATRKAYVM